MRDVRSIKSFSDAKVSVKFFAGSDFIVDAQGNEIKSYNFIPSYWMLKTFYKTYGKHADEIRWLPCEFDFLWSVKTMVEKIKQEKLQVACFGFYVWNVFPYINFIQKIKQEMPETIIIGGGPSATDEQVLENVDFCVYGDGEEAFTNLLDALIDKEDLSKIPNLIYNENGIKKTLHKRFQHKNFSLPSPYLNNKEEILESIDNFKATFGEKMFGVGWEKSRGCPYKCSFCDWSSGLHHKVSRVGQDWKQELEFILSMEASINITDANFGLIKDDEDVVDYLLNRKTPPFVIAKQYSMNKETRFPLSEISWSKLKKDVVYRIIKKILEKHPDYIIKISLQDIHEDVLESIDRPDAPWEEHKVYLQDVLKVYPNTYFMVELMVGLPNQTLDKWIDTLTQIDNVINNKEPRIAWVAAYLWTLLPNSPAYKKDYKTRYDLTVTSVKEMRPDISRKIVSKRDLFFAKRQEILWKDWNIVHCNGKEGLKKSLLMEAIAQIINAKLTYKHLKNKSFLEIYEKKGSYIKQEIDLQFKRIEAEKTPHLFVLKQNIMRSFKTYFTSSVFWEQKEMQF
tara:strand:- start:14657 stop:16357 length:1701 start_codon:yes stop_codon:yes gene_type:complete